MNKDIFKYLNKPKLYEKSSARFWDDEHISKGMLEAHLNPNMDGATRNLNNVNASVDWITKVSPPDQFRKLLDMGCGPGIYAEKFYLKGYQVTGIDLSKRSIDYAVQTAMKNSSDIVYSNMNYLDMSYEEEFDIITLIYCDFGVFSNEDRTTILQKVYRGLKSGGKFIVDVFTPSEYDNSPESNSWEYNDGDFWSPIPHLCLNSLYRYDDTNTMLRQSIIITEEEVNCYNIWEHTFTREELTLDFENAGFKNIDFYGDVTGAEYSNQGNIICVVATK